MLEGTKPGVFLSTLSLRRATKREHLAAFVPHISIHALLAESDPGNAGIPGPDQHFYPRSPCGERPVGSVLPCAVQAISIHALLAESDLFKTYGNWCGRYFYPRSPCGERQEQTISLARCTTFLSTLSLRRATKPLRSRLKRAIISIHALLAESDALWQVPAEKGTSISIHALLAESD